MRRFVFALLVYFVSVAPAMALEQPNIVLIVADDMGWNDVSYHGSEISTPNLDRLASSGVRLNRFYSQPTCSPTRASLLSGQSSMRLGITLPIDKNSEQGLDISVKILPQYLQEAGYQTWITGKWHLGHAYRDQLPLARGFDYAYGHMLGGVGYWDHAHGGGLDWHRNEQPLRQEGYATHLISDEATMLLRSREPEKPFFLYATFTAPHLPNEAPEDTLEKYAGIESPFRRTHAAMVDELDRAIGRILDELDHQEITRETLVWFISDNGGLNSSSAPQRLRRAVEIAQRYIDPPWSIPIFEFLRVNTLEGGSDNTPFRNGKGSVYEGGVRVPALLSWPGRLAQGKVDSRVTVQDVLPTLLSVIGVDLHSKTTIDGADQWPAIDGTGPVSTPDFVTSGVDGEALYRRNWKVVVSGSDSELYDLIEDPLEQHNVAEAHPNVLKDLSRALAEYPRGESIHSGAIWNMLVDPDRFGGPEDREPWAGQVRDR